MFVRTADSGEVRLQVAVSHLGGTFRFEGCLGIKCSEAVMALADIISLEGVKYVVNYTPKFGLQLTKITKNLRIAD